MHYLIRHSKRAKRVSIKIEPPDQVVVVAPNRIPDKLIDKFVQKQSSWIQAQLNKLKQKQNLIESKEQIIIFGKIYQKKTEYQPALPLGIIIQDNALIFNYPQTKHQDQTLLKKELELFLKKTARIYLEKKTKLLAKKMQVSYAKLSLRNQKTRWGSCSSSDNLSLNWRLVHYPPAVIDYVIIHELVHLIHHNHSRQFWQCVAEHDPDYKLHRNYLKRHGVTFS